MSKRWIKAGLTDQTIDIFILDSSSTTGAGLANLTHSSGGLTCYYRKGATGASTVLSLGTQTATGAHSDGGFCAVDNTNMPGLYRLDLSDTMVAAEGMLTIYLRGATNMAPVVAELEIVDIDIYDNVRLGLTALPNAAAEASGGLATLSAAQSSNGTIPVNVKSIAGQTASASAGVTFPASIGTSTLVATDVWSAATRTLTAGTNIVLDKGTGITGFNDPTAATIADTVWGSSLTVNSGSTAWANDTFGKSVLRAYNNTNAFIKTTGAGAGHVAADVHVMQDDVITAASIATNAITNDGLDTSACTEIWQTDISGYSTAGYAGTYLKNATSDWTADQRTAIRSALGIPASGTTLTSPAIVLAKTTNITGFNDLGAADIRSSVGLASANLDTQLGDLPTATENANAVWDATKSTWTDLGTKGSTMGYQLAVGVVPVTPPDAQTIANTVLTTASSTSSSDGTLSKVLAQLNTMIETVPSSNPVNYRFDAASLAESPAASSDWTANERTAIKAILGVTTDSATPGDPTTGILDGIRDRLPSALVNGRMDSYVGAMGADTVTSSAIATGAIDADSIAASAITSAKFASAAITGTVIQDGAISANKIGTGAITSGKFAAGAIDAAAIAAGAITVSEIADGAITAAKIADDAITKIWDKSLSAYSTAGQAGTYLKNAGVAAPNDIADALLNRKLDSSGSIFDISCQSFQGQSAFTGNNTFTAGDRVRFLNTAPSGFSTNQDYYVHPTGLTTSGFQLRSSPSSGNPILAQESNTFTLIPAEDRTVRSALRYLRNRVNIPTNTDTMTVYREDDVQRAWSSTVVGSADAVPVVDSNPVGGS